MKAKQTPPWARHRRKWSTWCWWKFLSGKESFPGSPWRQNRRSNPDRHRYNQWSRALEVGLLDHGGTALGVVDLHQLDRGRLFVDHRLLSGQVITVSVVDFFFPGTSPAWQNSRRGRHDWLPARPAFGGCCPLGYLIVISIYLLNYTCYIIPEKAV